MDHDFWFSKKSKQFLKNIDTFYYSVYLQNDLSLGTKDDNVLEFRAFLDSLRFQEDFYSLHFGDMFATYKAGSFANYLYRFHCPDFFDLFMIPTLCNPKMPAFIMQIRSKCLWEDGVYSCFERSYEFVQRFCARYGLMIEKVEENRCDFACHTNALYDPERFFNADNFAKMWVGRVGRLKDHTKNRGCIQTFYPDDSHEDDYVSIGKRGDKCFIRIYNKAKEVVVQGYKGFFLKLWALEGMISNYDLYCLEFAYQHKNWGFLNLGRLKWALEYDSSLSDDDKAHIEQLLGDDKRNFAEVYKLAKKLTPKVTKIYNIEFQVMRGMSASFQLVHHERNAGEAARVYDYLDSYAVIYDYLTTYSLRLVKPNDPDPNKSRRENTDFWTRLKRAKTIDFKDKLKVKLVREYTSGIDYEAKKKNALAALGRFGFSADPDTSLSMLDDVTKLLSIANDNDLEYYDRQKRKFALSHGQAPVLDYRKWRDIIILQTPPC